LIVILIAGIGFVIYILLKRYGPKGIAFAGFLGGLVNSTVTVTEMATRDRDSGGRLAASAYAGIVLATIASVLRNAILLAVLAPIALISASFAFVLMLLSGVAMLIARFRSRTADVPDPAQAELPLSSPFSITTALRYGLLFLVLQIAGVLAQRSLGHSGFYVVCLLGGIVSGASAVASAALLAAHGAVTPQVAATGSILATAVSALVNVAFTARVSRDTDLTKQLAWAMSIVAVLGVAGVVAQHTFFAFIAR
jgi:uncharacterized membrane protein (DUF4010 family)